MELLKSICISNYKKESETVGARYEERAPGGKIRYKVGFPTLYKFCRTQVHQDLGARNLEFNFHCIVNLRARNESFVCI